MLIDQFFQTGLNQEEEVFKFCNRIYFPKVYAHLRIVLSFNSAHQQTKLYLLLSEKMYLVIQIIYLSDSVGLVHQILQRSLYFVVFVLYHGCKFVFFIIQQKLSCTSLVKTNAAFVITFIYTILIELTKELGLRCFNINGGSCSLTIKHKV